MACFEPHSSVRPSHLHTFIAIFYGVCHCMLNRDESLVRENTQLWGARGSGISPAALLNYVESILARNKNARLLMFVHYNLEVYFALTAVFVISRNATPWHLGRFRF